MTALKGVRVIDPDNYSPPLPPHRAGVRGVLITKGSQVTIPPGGFKIFHRADGSLDSTIEIHVGLNMCPLWCDVAVEHVLTARENRIRALEAWATTSDKAFLSNDRGD
jgi:hypothetical protein